MPPETLRSQLARRGPELWVFGLLLASYAFFWHSRDWNTASRLMLTYALVDRGTIRLDGLERQTGDRASFQGHSYSDKLPGFSLLAVPVYSAARAAFRLPDHPRGVPGIPHWPADYWVTLGTSGLATAGLGALLTGLAGNLGCGPRRAALVGLAYGLATPAYVYATLAYGHQLSALALLGSFALIWDAESSRRPEVRLGFAGFLAATAPVIELQVGPVAAILGLAVVIQAAMGRVGWSGIATFTLGAAGPTLVLLVYNWLAFGSPWDMGYFHHVIADFSKVHSRANPLGLRRPDGSRAYPLLFGTYRGLFVYAPIVALAGPGWVALAARGRWAVALVSATACGAVFLVNLSYPEWTGGWSTGPRLLVVLLPFAMLSVAGLLAVGGRGTTGAAIALGLAGGVLMLLFQGVGGRVPQYFPEPIVNPVWRLWCGEPVPFGWVGARFDRTIFSWTCPEIVRALPPGWRWVQFLPLAAFQFVGIAAMDRNLSRRTAERRDRAGGLRRPT